MKANSVFMSQS